MIIECPACNTRYDIKAELPSEGRTVRCAKCGSVWRAMPEVIEEEPNEPVLAVSTRAVEAGRDQAAEDHHSDDHVAAANSQECEWTADDDGTSHERARSEEAHVEGEELESGGRDVVEADRDAGKVRWFSSFRRKKKVKENDAEESVAAPAMGHGSAETIPFPRTSVPAEAETSEIRDKRTLEEARQAVRSVFFGLGGGRSSSKSDSIPSSVNGDLSEEDRDEDQDREVMATGETQPRNRWASLFNRKGGARDAAESGSTSGAGALTHGLMAARQGASEAEGHDVNEEGEANEGPGINPDDALREALRAHFPSLAARANFAPEELAQKLETHFRSKAAATTEEEAPRNGLWGKAPASLDEEMIEAEPPAVVEEPVESKDDDAAFDRRLYREIEETQEKSGEPRRRTRRGGLALAAAWGLFLCIASGLIVGFFAFRDIIADAAPGLAPLYRTLGMPVTVQPLVFQDVRYEWSVAENKPVLIVSGNVFNQAHRKVRVPEFLITIKDQDPALDREYSANLRMNGSKIRSNQRADFDIELMSPNPTITSVELELRNVR